MVVLKGNIEKLYHWTASPASLPWNPHSPKRTIHFRTNLQCSLSALQEERVILVFKSRLGKPLTAGVGYWVGQLEAPCQGQASMCLTVCLHLGAGIMQHPLHAHEMGLGSFGICGGMGGGSCSIPLVDCTHLLVAVGRGTLIAWS